MKPLSPKFLLGTLVVTIIVVIGSIFVILAKLGFGTNIITGYNAFATGVVNITIQKTAGISLVFTNVSFGIGELNGDGTTTQINNSIGITNPSSFAESMPFTLRVDGNSQVNISFNGTIAGTFLGGTSPTFKVNVTMNEPGAFDNTTINGATMVEVLATYQQLANNTDFTDSRDEVNITVFLAIPPDSPSAAKNATLNFKAVSNSSSINP